MYVAASASTASVPECAPVPDEPSSSAAGSRAATASPPELGADLGLPYRSLRRGRDFAAAYRRGKRRRCGAVTMVVSPGPVGAPTVGFVAGKKVGSAVVRNRAKRRLRAAAARSRLESDTVYLLIADRGVLDAEFGKLVRWIDRCAEKMSYTGETG